MLICSKNWLLNFFWIICKSDKISVCKFLKALNLWNHIFNINIIRSLDNYMILNQCIECIFWVYSLHLSLLCILLNFCLEEFLQVNNMLSTYLLLFAWFLFCYEIMNIHNNYSHKYLIKFCLYIILDYYFHKLCDLIWLLLFWFWSLILWWYFERLENQTELKCWSSVTRDESIREEKTWISSLQLS